MIKSLFLKTLIATIIIWLAGVMAIRLGGNFVLVQGEGFIVGYLIAALSGVPTVWIAAKIVGLEMKFMMVPVLIIAAIALILDGFVMGFFPEVYTSSDKIRYLAPLFLWTFGWACISAFVMGGCKIPLDGVGSAKK